MSDRKYRITVVDSDGDILTLYRDDYDSAFERAMLYREGCDVQIEEGILKYTVIASSKGVSSKGDGDE